MAVIYRSTFNSNQAWGLNIDPRPGKDYLYMGTPYDQRVHDSKNLQVTNYADIWRGTKYNNTGTTGYAGNISASYTTSTNYYSSGLMGGGHPRIMPSSNPDRTYTIASSGIYANPGTAFNHAMSLDDRYQPIPIRHIVKSDGTQNIVHQNSISFHNADRVYGSWHVWEDIKDNETMHDTDPRAYTHENITSYSTPPLHCYYHEGTNSMVGPKSGGAANSNYISAVPGAHKWPLNISPDDTVNNTNYYINFNASAMQGSHMIGISEIDGNPIYLRTQTNGDHEYYVYKHNVAAHTITTLYSWNTAHTSGASQANGSGGKRSFPTNYPYQALCPSKWITTNQDGTNGYKYRMFYVPNWDSNGRLCPTVIEWDPGADTFVLGGYYRNNTNGYSGPPYVYNNAGGALTGSDIQTRQLPMSHSDLGSPNNYLTSMFVTETHGAYHSATNLETEPTAAMLNWKTNVGAASNGHAFLSAFNVHGAMGAADGNSLHRSIITFQIQDRSFIRFWGKVDVPETIRNFMWMNEERSRLLIMGKSNSYIYQFGAINTTGTYYSANSFGGYLPQNDGYGWTLTATLPGTYTHATMDKYGRFIAARRHEYHGTGNGTTVEMYTETTPVSVDFAGNATTDTITYTSSNIDKTLTVVAYNLFGKRVAASVNLIIHGTDMQFDNGTQNKTITTSASGTVSETVTVTGSGTTRISASYGT